MKFAGAELGVDGLPLLPEGDDIETHCGFSVCSDCPCCCGSCW